LKKTRQSRLCPSTPLVSRSTNVPPHEGSARSISTR
jgi:hypothetical protein